MAAKSCIFNEDSSSKSGASAADVPNIEKSYVSSTSSSSNSNDTGISQQQRDAFSSNDIQRPPFLASSTTNLELKSTSKNGNDTTINVVHKLATLFDDKGREKDCKGRRSEILVGKFVQKSVVTSSDASRLRRNISSTSSLRSRSTDSRGRTVETTCNQSIMTSSFDLTDDVGADDLNFSDSKSKFTSARAMFENLERRSRHTTRNSIPKTPDSSNPKERLPFAPLFSDRVKHSPPPESGAKLSPKTAAAAAPPIPPKPKNIASPIVTSPIRVSGLSNKVEQNSFLTPESPKKETFSDESSNSVASKLDFSALNNVADEFTQLVNNLFNIESVENIIPVTSNCTAPTCLGYGAISNTTVITYSDSSSSSSTKVVCNESPVRESATIYIPDSYRNSSTIVNTSLSPTATIEPNFASLVTIKAPKSSGDFEAVDKTKGAVMADSNLAYADETDEAKSNVSSDNEKIVIIPVIENSAFDEAHTPPIDTEAVRFRNRNAPPTAATGTDEDSREIKSLSCHVSVPQDFEADLKRLSTCSMESSAIEHMVVSNFDKYLISNEAEIHWISETDFYIEVPNLNDSGALDLTTTSSEYKPPSKITFSSGKIRVFSTYSPEEYDRRNEDIDPISASAEYELERRLEKMDIIDVEIDKGNEGLGISIIGMGVGADAGLEKLGIFVKSITPGGPIYRDGRVFICDQIVEVDGKSLVGVSQTYAASVLRSTNGIVKFKLGREKDLETSEIAQLIRQSLEQDHMAIVKEQENLAKRLNMSNDVNTLIPKDEQPIRPSDNASSAQFLQSPSTPVRNENTRESSVTSDSVFGEENPTKISSENQQIDQLISELRKQDDSPFIAYGYGEKPSPTTKSNVRCEKPNSFRMEEEELSNIHPLPDHYSRDSGLESKQSSHDKGNKHPFFDHKHYSLDVSDDEEKLISKRIDFLETTLNDVKRDAEKYQQLLVDSQCHYFDLQKQYDSAKKKIKDFENREKNMIEREEACLKELREKDSQYTQLVQQLYDRVAILERQLNEALKKRSSFAETNGHSAESYGYRTTINTDTSPALAYLPGKKVSERDAGATWSKKSALDSKPRSVSFEDECATTSTDGITSISTYPMSKYGQRDRRYDNVQNHSFDFGIPKTTLLDNKAAKSKAEAVKQSTTMCARSLPSRHADAEVFVLCHHTMEHAEHLKRHPCHVITEMPCTCPKMLTEQDQNECSPCKDSLASTSSSSCQNNTLSSNNNNNVTLNNNGLVASSFPNHNNALSSTAVVNNAFNSPLITRKLADLLNRRRKSSPNISATNRGSSKDLERTMCGGRDNGPDKLSEVQHWNYEDVNNFLRTIGMEKYQSDFTCSRIDGCKLLQLDGTKLKAVGVTDNNDRALIKKRVKQMKLILEKERKKETKKLLHIPLLDKDRRLLKH